MHFPPPLSIGNAVDPTGSCSYHTANPVDSPYEEAAIKFPEIKTSRNARGSGKTPAPAKPGLRRRLINSLSILSVGAAVCATLLACCLLWKPSGLRQEGAEPDFIAVIARSGLPSAAGALLSEGAATVWIRQSTLEDLVAALVDRTNKSVPGVISSRVRAQLPRELEEIAGLKVSESGINVVLKCRKYVTFYLGITLVPRLGGDGGLVFDIAGASAGVLPLPLGIARKAAGRALSLPPARTAGLRITRLEVSDGTITMDLETDMGGSQWLKTLSEQ